MKKRIITSVFSLCIANALFAQGIATPVRNFLESYIEPVYPLIAAAALIVGVLVNIGKFRGEDRDIKSGIINIVIFLAVVIIIVPIYEIVKNLSL